MMSEGSSTVQTFNFFPTDFIFCAKAGCLRNCAIPGPIDGADEYRALTQGA